MNISIRPLLSLWEIMENFYPLSDRIRKLAYVCGVFMNMPVTMDVDASIIGKVRESLNGIEQELHKFELDAASDRLDKDGADLRSDYLSVIFTTEKLNALIDAMLGQLRRRYYIPIPTDVAEFYEKPEAKFPLTVVMFPSASSDIKEACRCFALERYTACVFHAMGILQVGLYALAAECKVTFPFKIELADWENVITATERKIKDMADLPKSDQKDSDLKFYSALATQFRYFKNAWRNHVAHLREEYDKDQAHSILIHVRDFMEQAAVRLKEIPSP